MLKKLIIVLFIGLMTVTANSREIESQLKNLITNAFAKQKSIDSIIDLATNNKMLSQKIAKCAVLIKNDILPQKNHELLMESAKEFDGFVQGMYNGDASLNLKKESDKQVLQELDEVNDEWKRFYTNIKILYINEKVDKVAYQYIIDNNEKLLRISHKLTQTIQSKTIINNNDNRVIVNTLKFADRQKMLTQKMLKEKFLVYTNENAKRNNVRLRGSIILFKNGLQGLINGDETRGIAKVTNSDIRDKLEKIQILYNASEALYIRQHIAKDEIEVLARLDARLLELSSEVLTMIQNTLVY